MPDFYWWRMFRAGILGQLGRREAASEMAKAQEINPALNPTGEIEKWNGTPEDAAHWAEGFKKAGFEG